MGQAKPLASRLPFHYAWVVIALTFLTTLTGAGIRSAAGVLIHPLEVDFGWNRALISSAHSINLLMYGVAAPISGRLTDRFGPRLAMLGSMGLLAVGVAGTLVMHTVWQFYVFWGIVSGLGAGGVASVLSAAVANRWFSARRGLALGILNSASSTGQLIFLPLLMAVIVAAGWRGGLALALLVVLAMLPIIYLWMRNDPEDIGLLPYGAAAAGLPAGPGPAAPAADAPLVPIWAAARKATFWYLSGAYFVCGATSAGLIGTHLIPHAIDHGFPEMTAAATVGIMGGMNFVGTLLAGWLSDRIDPRKILVFVFTLRGASLFMLPFVHNQTGLFAFGVIFGLDWFATVPPVMALTADTFGKRSVGSVYGWIFLSHQIGSAVAAIGAGSLRVALGDYQWAFLTGGLLALIGGALALGITPRRRQASDQGALQPTGTGRG